MKKTISLVLIICMLFSLFPTAAFAAENNGTAQNKPAYFSDVNPSDWYYTTVMEASEKGWMVGVSDTEFAPNGSATRAMIVTILHRFEQSPQTAQNQFADVTQGDWYYQSVNWAAENGIVSGIGNSMFGPNQAITREQLAAILMNYAKMKKYDTSITADLIEYADRGNISSWALDSMKWANGKGLINGKDASHLDPTGTATRAEIATILVRFQQLFSKTEKPVTGTIGGSSYVSGGSATNTKPGSGDNTSGGSTGETGAENGICYSVSGLELKDGKADLMVNTIDECTLVLTVYEEEGSFFQNQRLGKKLFSSRTKVNGALNYEQISVPADVTKNRDMVITAVLVDENGNELHDVYYCLDYTGAYREFQAKTIYDFEDQNQVVNLDEKIDNNFVVFRSDVKVFRESVQKNRVITSSAYSITFADPDDVVSNAKAGDRVAIVLADNNVIVVIVSEVVTDNEGIQIVYEEADSIVEDYVFIKIETDVAANGVQSGDEVEYDTVQYSYAASGARSVPDINLNPDITSKIKLKQDLKLSENTTLSISGEGRLTVHVKVFYDLVLFGADYLEIGITEDANATFTLNLFTGVDGSNPGKDEANQASMGDKLEKEFSFVGNFPTNIPLVEIEGGMKIPVKLLLGVGFSSTVELKDTTGFSYKRLQGEKSDKQKIKKNEINITALKAEGSFSPEIALKPIAGFNILAGAVKPNINGQYGLKGSCKVTSPAVTVAQNASEKHDCYACVSASVKDYASVGLELKIKWDDDEKYKTAFSWDMASTENIYLSKDWKCYFSVDNLEFGIGSCPYKSYRTTVATKDSAGNAVNGLSVKVFSKDNGPEYTANDMHYWYLPKGSYTAFTNYNGHTYRQDFKVDTKSNGYIANGEIRVVITIDGAETNSGTPEQPGDDNPSDTPIVPTQPTQRPEIDWDGEIVFNNIENADKYQYIDVLKNDFKKGRYILEASLQVDNGVLFRDHTVHASRLYRCTMVGTMGAAVPYEDNKTILQRYKAEYENYFNSYIEQHSNLIRENVRGRWEDWDEGQIFTQFKDMVKIRDGVEIVALLEPSGIIGLRDLFNPTTGDTIYYAEPIIIGDEDCIPVWVGSLTNLSIRNITIKYKYLGETEEEIKETYQKMFPGYEVRN